MRAGYGLEVVGGLTLLCGALAVVRGWAWPVADLLLLGGYLLAMTGWTMVNAAGRRAASRAAIAAFQAQVVKTAHPDEPSDSV